MAHTQTTSNPESAPHTDADNLPQRRVFILFLLVALGLYIGLNADVFWHLSLLFPNNVGAVHATGCVFLLALCYPIGETLERFWPSSVSTWLVRIGAVWLFLLTYAFLATLAIDVLWLISLVVPYLPSIAIEHPILARQIVGAVIISTIVICGIVGFVNAAFPVLKQLHINLSESNDIGQAFKRTLRIAAISDMHLGTIIGRRRVARFVRMLNQIDADLVLFVGDQIDGNPYPIIDHSIGEELRTVKNRLGMFGITGNHEYLGNVETACAYLEQLGIQMLRDEVREVGGIYLIGREDPSANRADHPRAELSELVSKLDQSRPRLLFDHQPSDLSAAADCGISLQLSGHTHHGQIWPFQYITRAVYQLSWGYMKLGQTHYYVSCGAGTWGPPMRLGNRPEVLSITLEFTDTAGSTGETSCE